MQWKFWQKEAPSATPKATEIKLSGPENINDAVGRYLVVELGKDPDWVWNLKDVLRQRSESKSSFDVRVFSHSKAVELKVHVKNYLTLEDHPELILFEGWVDKKTQKVELHERTKIKAA